MQKSRWSVYQVCITQGGMNIAFAAPDEKCEACWSWVGPNPPRSLGARGKQCDITSLWGRARCTLLATAVLLVCCVTRDDQEEVARFCVLISKIVFKTMHEKFRRRH